MAGLSPFSNYVETVAFMQTCGFSLANGVAFSVYGETLIIMCQNFIIIALIWMYNKEVSAAQKAAVALSFAGYAYALFTPGVL